MAKLRKVIFFANTDWYLLNFRLPLAKALQMRGFDVVLMSPAGRFVPEIIQAGFRHIEFPLSRRSINPLTEVVTIWRLIQIYLKERPAFVHHFTVKCVLYGSFAARVTGIKYILNAVTGLGHVFIDNTIKTRFLRLFVKFFYKIVLNKTKIIFQNPDDQQAFISYRLVQPKQCYLIRGSGVNVNIFTPRSHDLPCQEVHVVFAGRLLWSKGLGELMQAAAHLNNSNVPVRFTIAGEEDPGNPAAVPSEALEKWRKLKYVSFVGNQRDMVTLLQHADIVVLPSYREGVPRVLLEAAACGKPLVTTDVPGCREIVQDGVNGVLVPVKEVQKLCEALLSLINNAELREVMGQKSRRLVCEEFSEECVITRTAALYPTVAVLDA